MGEVGGFCGEGLDVEEVEFYQEEEGLEEFYSAHAECWAGSFGQIEFLNSFLEEIPHYFTNRRLIR